MGRLIDRLGFGRWRCRRDQSVKRFRENQLNEEAFETIDRGVHPVSLDQIVGSVGRYHDFDSSFRLKHAASSERYGSIRQALRNGKYLPPVNLYQIRDEYYVLDGNHRVSAAKEIGHRVIDAKILEFIPSKKTLENILYREKSDFREKTCLKSEIPLTELGQYNRLIQQIGEHQSALEQASQRPVPFQQAAEDWYRTIYCPLVSIIEKGGLLARFPGRTIADLYAYISYHQWERNGAARQYGIGIGELVPNDMEAFREKMSQLKEAEYPDMLREITAFILMNISARKEERIIDKLIAIEEIKEVHSVHGNVDILAKAVIKRDLLTSDAETIGQFVQQKVRQISGIVSTQTLIPAFSRKKESSA